MKHCNFQQKRTQSHVISCVLGGCSHLLRKQLQRLFNVLRQLCKLDACSMKVLAYSAATVQWLVPPSARRTWVLGQSTSAPFWKKAVKKVSANMVSGNFFQCFHVVIIDRMSSNGAVVYAPVRARAVNATMFGFRARVETRSKKYLAARCCFLLKPQQARTAEDTWYIWMLIP